MRKTLALSCILLAGLAWFLNIHAMQEEPKEYNAHLETAAAKEEKGIYADAIEEYEAALEMHPENVDARIHLANDYLANDNSSKYVSLMKETAENFQDNTEAMDSLMNYYIDNGDEDKAVKYLATFVESHPDNENASKWYSNLKGSYKEIYVWYDQIGDMYNDYIPAENNELWGLMDSLGSSELDCEFDSIQPFSGDGYALAELEGKTIYIDKKGQTRMVPDTGYQDLGMFSSGCAAASKNGKYGLLDEEMEPVTDFTWDAVTSVRESVGAACKDGKWALIDKTGAEITDYQYDDVAVDDYNFCCFQDRIFVSQNGKYILVDGEGKQIGNETFDDAQPFTKDGYAAVCKKGKWGYVNTDGEVVIDYQYAQAKSFSYGYAAVGENDLWGYIDENNQLIIEEKFTDAGYFSEKGSAVIEIKEDEDTERMLIRLDLCS